MPANDDFHTQLLRYGIDLGFLLSGFFGAILLTIKKRRQKLSKSVGCILAGTLCANYLTPLILNFAPESIQDKGKYAVAFMMGYIGLKGLESVVEILGEYLNQRMQNKLKKN